MYLQVEPNPSELAQTDRVNVCKRKKNPTICFKIMRPASNLASCSFGLTGSPCQLALLPRHLTSLVWGLTLLASLTALPCHLATLRCPFALSSLCFPLCLLLTLLCSHPFSLLTTFISTVVPLALLLPRCDSAPSSQIQHCTLLKETYNLLLFDCIYWGKRGLRKND